MERREFDVVVYGASGFAAKYIIERLVGSNLRLAVSGRDPYTIRKNVGTIVKSNTIEVIQCEVDQIHLLARRTKILLNCAGPYIFSGMKVIKACVDEGTHYMDIAGETLFVEEAILEFDEAARRKNLMIVNCCGFDSTPADIGVEYLKENMEATPGEMVEIRSVLRLKNAYINLATYVSFVHSLANISMMRKLRDRRKKAEARRKSRTKSETCGGNRFKMSFYDESTKSYNVAFMGTDASIVRRTQEAMKSSGKAYARYLAYVEVGSYFNLNVVRFLFSMVMILSRSTIGRWILLKFPSLFTMGRVKTRPSIGSDASFDMILSSKRTLRISGPDPAYITTAICASEAVLCILRMLDDGEPPREKCGVVTPAIALAGSDIVERMRKAGVSFSLT